VRPDGLSRVTPAFLRLDRVTGALPLPDGVEPHFGKTVLRITALVEGILRVCVTPDGASPPDVSWAVLPWMQCRSAQVIHVSA
jgi:hypothetical protein